MALNDDWLADVRRWYFDERHRNGGTPLEGVASDLADAEDPLGYEAAWPAALDRAPGTDAGEQDRPELR